MSNRKRKKDKSSKNLNEIEKKKAFLIKKGYNLFGKNKNFIIKLYEMYPNNKKTEPVPKNWTMWGGTNRPHHSGDCY